MASDRSNLACILSMLFKQFRLGYRGKWNITIECIGNNMTHRELNLVPPLPEDFPDQLQT